MHPIDNAESQDQQQPVFEQMAHGRTVTHYINQVAAGTVDRQKGKQGQQGNHGPDRLISFQVM